VVNFQAPARCCELGDTKPGEYGSTGARTDAARKRRWCK